jgi:hypothetical protein
LGLVAAVIAVGARNQMADARSSIVSNTRPIPPVVSRPETTVPAEAPASTDSVIKPQGEVTASAETVPATRLGYDLDHALPMGNETREGKQATY